MNLKTTLTLLLSLTLSQYLHASPPNNSSPQKITQPNGTQFLATTYGDAWFSWKETRDGLVIMHNKETGYYDYAVIREVNGKKILLPSGIHVDATGNPGAHSRAFDAVKRKDVYPLQRAALKEKGKSQKPKVKKITLEAHKQ